MLTQNPSKKDFLERRSQNSVTPFLVQQRTRAEEVVVGHTESSHDATLRLRALFIDAQPNSFEGADGDEQQLFPLSKLLSAIS